jgi:uncharacterized protein YqjF (DUF2071 family)
MSRSFLTAEWRKLIMANYPVAGEVLEPFRPAGTALDLYKGECYVSLVGFLFQNTRLKSIPSPFHRTFEEVNLRFYVQHTTASGERRRGVVFLSELVPRLALSLVANTVYGENYATVAMRHEWKEGFESRSVGYYWKQHNRRSELRVKAALESKAIAAGSAEEFFTEHYWGYTKRGAWTSEDQVLHPRWESYEVLEQTIDVDFGGLYGEAFAGLSGRVPESILLAEGSEVEVRSGERLDW